MSAKELMQQIVKGAAFATAAALLAPINVIFLLRGTWYAVAAIGLVQVVLLGVGITIMLSASKKARK